MHYYSAEWDDEKQAWYIWDNTDDTIVKWCSDKEEAYDLRNRLNDGHTSANRNGA